MTTYQTAEVGDSWCIPAEGQDKEGMLFTERDGKENLNVYVREEPGVDAVSFVVTRDCLRGTCACIHTIAGMQTQLRPCRVFTELFMRGETDMDWALILAGVVFGFRVINRDCFKL